VHVPHRPGELLRGVLPVKPTSAAPERILAYGAPGSGKSRGWATIAQMYRQTNTPGHFHVLSTEAWTMDRMKDGYPPTDSDPGWDENITVHEATNWLELEAAGREVAKVMTRGDWVVLETLTSPWEWVRNYYDETRPGYKPIGTGADPFQVEVEPNRNWDSIKQVYYAFINQFHLSDVHLYACAHEETLRVDGFRPHSPEAIKVFKYIGAKAVTEKTAPYVLHSVLYMQRAGAKKWTVTTVDDHERDYLAAEEVTSFPFTYLLGPGGWTL
jgi:hypothetical protein